MAIGILGRKVGMTQIFDEAGKSLPVTAIEAGPCTVLAVRDLDRDGYRAVQLGFLDKPRRLATRPERGHVASIDSKARTRRNELGLESAPRAECEPKRFIREIRLNEGQEYTVGDEITVDIFAEISNVDVTGTSKGRGFAGVMKRYGFAGLRASHGVQRHHRAPGSIGGHGTDLGNSGRIKKGKRMAGQYGNAKATVRNLKVVRVDAENGVLLVLGAIPGANGGYVIVKNTNKCG